MLRRRRPKIRESFSFDSFLDVVANVVGIIIRLILVVWVGARSYGSLANKPALDDESLAPAGPLHEADEPAYVELQSQKRKLQELQAKLLEQLRTSKIEQDGLVEAEPQEQLLMTRVEEAREARRRQAKEGDRGAQALQVAALSTAAIEARCAKLAEEMRTLERTPVPKRTLRYRTPVSRPVQSDEFHFELQKGRVTFVDVYGMLREFTDRRDDIERKLQSTWQTVGTFGPIGAFRMLYTAEREQGVLDALASPGAPSGQRGYRYGLAGWQIQPIDMNRGETAAEALRPGSTFRQLADRLDPLASAVTFWVYPDSFAAFRQLRDFLYERDITVAGRPLPDGVPIASSRRGTASRGQ